MVIFTDKDVKLNFAVIAALLFSLIILGQVIVKLIMDDYKREMIAHDYEIAGYLYRNDLDKSQIANAFTKEKTNDDFTAGQELLQVAGYSDRVKTILIPEVESFRQKYAVLMLALSVVLSMAILAVVLIFSFRQDRKLEKADHAIRSFMDGNVHMRLDDTEEGSLSKLFNSVNALATSLTSHIVKEKQNKEFLRDMISNISHQLKTPLAALQMYNEIIQDENTGNAVINNFTLKSENEFIRMEHLIQNLLKLAKLDAGTIELEKSNQNVKEFLEKSIKRFRTRAELESKSFTLDCNNHITLNCDAEWLLEAVSNIIKNALDHTNPKGRIDIICDEAPVVTRITIKDNGMGIHPEDIHYIFKRFYRSRFSKDKQGIGIGLTLSKAIVEKHGGTIMVESELGKGTTFHLTFSKLTNL